MLDSIGGKRGFRMLQVGNKLVDSLTSCSLEGSSTPCLEPTASSGLPKGTDAVTKRTLMNIRATRDADERSDRNLPFESKNRSPLSINFCLEIQSSRTQRCVPEIRSSRRWRFFYYLRRRSTGKISVAVPRVSPQSALLNNLSGDLSRNR